ncbi:FUSC family protein [Microterricola viridarii]|uniref:Fusaric acid resistance protein-like n=1 Tax=Microterricola viridarii TaxID=412690 RepID=A0A1H1UHW4_9MICO|nr:FUSC family protein [Microterricola viridarii]SDS72095.1 Fusaric acid resistance protein-like [Microterricola viridarii]
MTSRIQSSSRVPLLQVTKVAFASVLAWIVAQLLLPTELPIFAAIAALLVVQPSVNQTLGRAIERTVGVIAGVIVATVIAQLFGSAEWIILITIVVAIFIGWALRLTPASANQIPITAMLVLALGTTTPGYAVERSIETLIGAVIGFIVTISIAPPVLLAPAQESVAALGNELAATIDRLADALEAPMRPAQLEELLLNARLLRPMQAKANEAVKEGRESLAFNPRRSRLGGAVEAEAALLARLSPLVNRVIGMTRALRDHYDDSLSEEPTVHAIAAELKRAAHDLRLLIEPDAAVPGEAEVQPEQPALTAPLVIATPHPEHWILIGSLMEDLRRVREEIVGD